MERVTDLTCDHLAVVMTGYNLEQLSAICLEPEPHGAWHVAAAMAVRNRDRVQLAQVLRDTVGGAMPEDRLDVLDAVMRRYTDWELEQIVASAEKDGSTEGRWYQTAKNIINERRAQARELEVLA